jgi:hypothetical protein
MAQIAGRRLRAEIDGGFVVFLIGARFNSKLHLARSFLDVGGRRGMRHMLQYLTAHPDKGLLGFQQLGPVNVVQYWRSFEHLEAFGLGRAGRLVPASQSSTARSRLRAPAG